MSRLPAAFKQRVARLLYPYGSVRRVLRGALKGTRFYCAPAMGFTYAFGGMGLEWDFWEQRIRRGMTIYDIGGNYGQMALFFSKMCGIDGKVYSFEPMPHLAAHMKKNLQINPWCENVQIINSAVADKPGTATFLFSDEMPQQGSLLERIPGCQSARTITVDVTSIDAFIEQGFPCPDILKIDVEGAAALVFNGAEVVIRSCNPAIFLELHNSEEQNAVVDYLFANGYRAETLQGEEVLNPRGQWYSTLWCYRN